MCFEMIRINDLYRYIGREKYLIVDLRDREDYEKGHIPEAINIPYETKQNIKSRLQGYSKVFFYCKSGTRSLMAIRDNSDLNVKLYNLGGGIDAWRGKLVK